MRVKRSLLAVILLAICVPLAACGGDGQSGNQSETTGTIGSDKASLGPPTILTLNYNDGEGGKQSARLTCDDREADGTGYLRDAAEAACREIEAAGTSLFDEPPAGQACTQVYGGPETLRVSGRVNFDAVKRSFGRSDGCEIADWNKIGPLLPKDVAGSTS